LLTTRRYAEFARQTGHLGVRAVLLLVRACRAPGRRMWVAKRRGGAIARALEGGRAPSFHATAYATITWQEAAISCIICDVQPVMDKIPCRRP
jgi:hypothetical protein